MASMKTIKRRLASVTTTKKVMKAMNMVAATKLQRDKSRLEAAQPFIEECQKIKNIISSYSENIDNVFLQSREVKNIAYLIITSDRGFCGSYNSNLLELLSQTITEGNKTKLFTIGSKGYDYLKSKSYDITQHYPDVLETAFYEDAVTIAQQLQDFYQQGEVDEVYIAYTQFRSALSHLPTLEKILPITLGDSSPITNKQVIIEPDLTTYLSTALPLLISTAIYTALLESSTCEQAARMVSMDSAVNNASDIIDKLTRSYNRNRQAAITQEIGEAVGSSNILSERSDSL